MAAKLDVHAGYVDPSLYDVDADGCHIWKHSQINGYAVITIDQHHELVRRVLFANMPDKTVIRATCRKKLCVNPKHLYQAPSKHPYQRGSPTGRGLIDMTGRPRATAYDVNERGCHIWKGHISGQTPIATFRGLRVSVRALLLGLGGHVKTRSTCGNWRCVNPDHIYLPGPVTAAKQALKRENRIKRELNRAPREERSMRWVRDDVAKLVAQDPDNKARLTQNQLWAIRAFAEGFSQVEMAAAAGVTRQAISLQVRSADRRLRCYLAGTPLQ